MVSPAESRSHLLCLVFTDLVDSTGLKARLGDGAAGELIGRHHREVRRLLGDAGGREIDSTGDGFFLTFDSPSAAVRFALELQEIHGARPEMPAVRVGIHVGEVSERAAPAGSAKPTLVEGLAVDIAARICGLASPGQILMSGPAFNAARQRLDTDGLQRPIEWRAHGPYLLKGYDEPLQISEAGCEGLSPLAAPGDSEKARRAVAAGDELTLGWRPAIGLEIPGRPRWRLERQLGTGAVGEVWLAAHEKTEARRVYKFCFQADRVRGLKREVTLLRLLKHQLGNRSDIAQLIDWEFEEAPYFLEEQYSEAGDMLEWARSRGGLDAVPLEVRLSIVAQIAEALAAAHGAGVLHRDLKPANVLVSGDSQSSEPHVSLTDFGIGLVVSREALAAPGVTIEGLTETLLASSSTSGAGTRLYVAPELIEGKPATPLSDVYSLGVILYQMVVGDFSRALAPGWEDDVDDPLLRADIADCVDGRPERRLAGPLELAERLRALGARRARARASRRRRAISLTAAAALLLAFAGYQVTRFLQHRANVQWAHETALPQILELAFDRQFAVAFALAEEARRYIPDDPVLAQNWALITNEIAVKTEPAGAKVSYRDYRDPDAEWRALGETPLEATVPVGPFRWRIEKPGYQTREIAAEVMGRGLRTQLRAAVEQFLDRYPAMALPGLLNLKLDPSGASPVGMVAVDKATVLVQGFGRFSSAPVELERFWIDKTEVTNAQFKEFVDARGYERPELWTVDFMRDGEPVSWDEAMGAFVDSTGRSGPATWAEGRYDEGTGDHPVTGISWYEAVAYAAFRGKVLPTVHHWVHAALGGQQDLSEAMLRASNFGDAIAPVGQYGAISFAGAYDMAGNVSEWLWNAEASGQRYVLGGAWGDAVYTFSVPGVSSPWIRDPTRGFRCALYADPELARPLEAPLPLMRTDWDSLPAVSDEVYEATVRADYDPTPLNAVVDSSTETDWGRHEHVAIDAAYRGERLPLWLMLPRNAKPPYQTVVMFPGLESVMNTERPSEYGVYAGVGRLFAAMGRVVILPIYSDTFQRNDGQGLRRLGSAEGVDLVRRWKMDLGRTHDYIEQREDLNGASTAYLGLSMGTVLAPYLLDRFHVALLWSGAVDSWEPESSAILHKAALKRVTIPVLMVNGRYDVLHPVKYQEKMFGYLGTAEPDKRHVIYDAGHSDFPINALFQDNKAWLDRYLGEVERVE